MNHCHTWVNVGYRKDGNGDAFWQENESLESLPCLQSRENVFQFSVEAEIIRRIYSSSLRFRVVDKLRCDLDYPNSNNRHIMTHFKGSQGSHI